MNNYFLSEDSARTYEADGFAVYKMDDFFMKLWISVRKDSQIPEFDVITDVKVWVSGVDEQHEYSLKLFDLVSDGMGFFVDDAYKLSDVDINSSADSPVVSLVALKKAICNYLRNTGQEQRLASYLDKIVCKCRNVTDTRIRELSYQFKGDLERVKRVSGAGLSCGSCVKKIEEIVNS
jgi:bacterioferritin-associated ferredoxin